MWRCLPLCFLLGVLQFQVLHSRLSSILSCFLWCETGVQFFYHHLLKKLSFLYCIFLAPFLQISWPYMHGLISGISILFCWSMCLFLAQYYIDYYNSVLQFGIQKYDVSGFVLCQDCWDYLGSFMVLYKFLRLLFLFLWKLPLEFWYRLHWICRSLWVVCTF